MAVEGTLAYFRNVVYANFSTVAVSVLKCITQMNFQHLN